MKCYNCKGKMVMKRKERLRFSLITYYACEYCNLLDHTRENVPDLQTQVKH